MPDIHIHHVFANLNTKEKIRCDFEGQPEIKVTWKKAGKKGSSSSLDPKRIRKEGNTLYFKQVKKEDEGQYFCKGENSFSSAESYVNISVIGEKMLTWMVQAYSYYNKILTRHRGRERNREIFLAWRHLQLFAWNIELFFSCPSYVFVTTIVTTKYHDGQDTWFLYCVKLRSTLRALWRHNYITYDSVDISRGKVNSKTNCCESLFAFQWTILSSIQTVLVVQFS